MRLCSCASLFTLVVVGAIAVYSVAFMFIAASAYIIFYPDALASRSDTVVIKPAWDVDAPVDLYIYGMPASRRSAKLTSDDLLLHESNFVDGFERSINVTLPSSVLNNGTYNAHVFVCRGGHNPLTAAENACVRARRPLTRWQIPQTLKSTSALLTGSSAANTTVEDPDLTPVTHWKPRLVLRFSNDGSVYNARRMLATDLGRALNVTTQGTYLPSLLIDELWVRSDALLPVNGTAEAYPLDVRVTRGVLGWIHLVMLAESTFESLGGMFNTEELDIARRIFDTDFTCAITELVASFLHTMFDLFALKADFEFWRGRSDLVGLSPRSLLIELVCRFAVLLFLLDRGASATMLVGAVMSMVMTMWKLRRVATLRKGVEGGEGEAVREKTDIEKATEQADKDAYWYLGWVLFPLFIGFTAYSLVYEEHTGWYSFALATTTSFLLASGFIFTMTSQLYINYKLKSVEHMPLRVYVYMMLNTVVEELSSLVIPMPMLRRLAVLRNEILFVIFLVQWWVYRNRAAQHVKVD